MSRARKKAAPLSFGATPSLFPPAAAETGAPAEASKRPQREDDWLALRSRQWGEVHYRGCAEGLSSAWRLAAEFLAKLKPGDIVDVGEIPKLIAAECIRRYGQDGKAALEQVGWRG